MTNARRVSFLLLSALSGSCLAQTSVLFGVLDANAMAIKNGSTKTWKGAGTDGLSSSRLGFRGTEDLGDGFKAGFWLEATIAPDTGTANATRFWNRRSTVSLLDPRWGELRIGRDNTPTKNAYDAYDPFGTNGIGEILGNGTTIGLISTLGSGANTISRSDNQVSYYLPPVLGGVYGQLAVAPGEDTTGNRYTSGRIGYAKGPVDVSVVYAETKVALRDKFKQGLIGASYDFGPVKLTGEFIEARYNSTAGGKRRQRVVQVGAFVPFGNHVVRVDYIHSDLSGGAAGSGFGDKDDADQAALGYQYNFSKRTAIYTTASLLRNKGASKQVVASGYSGIVAGENSKGINAGIRHSF